MKIGILGTRGIPNKYGGFEEFAEIISQIWAKEGHQVFVYCQDNGEKEKLNIPNIKQIFIQPGKIATINQFIYDYRCTKHAISQNLDIYYHTGYGTSIPGNLLLRKGLGNKLVYNMDGLEWKRSKFNFFVRKLTLIFEYLAVKSTKYIISDNEGITDYLREKYKIEPYTITYGSIENRTSFKINEDDILPPIFDLVIARFEPENHIELILKTVTSSTSKTPLVLVANKTTKLYRKLKKGIVNSDKIIFIGPIYDRKRLAYLRNRCRYYIHGHSVGGTNPSLLEALISGCTILYHDNIFNRKTVGLYGYPWRDEKDLKNLLEQEKLNSQKEDQIKFTKMNYDWKDIGFKHLQLFKKINEKNKFK